MCGCYKCAKKRKEREQLREAAHDQEEAIPASDCDEEERQPREIHTQ